MYPSVSLYRSGCLQKFVRMFVCQPLCAIALADQATGQCVVIEWLCVTFLTLTRNVHLSGLVHCLFLFRFHLWVQSLIPSGLFLRCWSVHAFAFALMLMICGNLFRSIILQASLELMVVGLRWAGSVGFVWPTHRVLNTRQVQQSKRCSSLAHAAIVPGDIVHSLFRNSNLVTASFHVISSLDF